MSIDCLTAYDYRLTNYEPNIDYVKDKFDDIFEHVCVTWTSIGALRSNTSQVDIIVLVLHNSPENMDIQQKVVLICQNSLPK